LSIDQEATGRFKKVSGVAEAAAVVPGAVGIAGCAGAGTGGGLSAAGADAGAGFSGGVGAPPKRSFSAAVSALWTVALALVCG
jgi:hypothetical protein